MAEHLFHVDADGNGNQLVNWSQKQSTSAPTLEGELVFRTDLNKYQALLGGTVYTLASEAHVLAAINSLGQAQTTFDASPGSLPTAANKTSGDTTQVLKGDYWWINTPGTIAGIQGDDVLAVGDVLIYLGGGVGTAANWLGVNRNIDENTLGGVKAETQTVSLVANTPLAVTAASITTIRSIEIYNSAGRLITVRVDITGANQRTLTSNQSLANVRVDLLGV